MKNFPVITAILFLLILAACESSINHNNRKTKEIFVKSIADSSEVPAYSDKINIDTLIFIIKKIYGFTDYHLQTTNLDTVHNYFMENFEIYIENEDGSLDTNTGDHMEFYTHSLYAFSPDNANNLYEYGPFSFLEFKNDSLAKDAFRKILVFFRNSELSKQYTSDHLSLFHNVFTKSGAAYFLKDEFIIRYWRTCSEDYKKENMLESRFLKLLHPKGLPADSGYFMKYCCSCPAKFSFEIR